METGQLPQTMSLKSTKFYVSLDFWDFWRIFMILYDFVWLCMILYDFVWLCMILYDYVWFCMILYDFVWFCMIMYDFVWFCMTILFLNLGFFLEFWWYLFLRFWKYSSILIRKTLFVFFQNYVSFFSKNMMFLLQFFDKFSEKKFCFYICIWK